VPWVSQGQIPNAQCYQEYKAAKPHNARQVYERIWWAVAGGGRERECTPPSHTTAPSPLPPAGRTMSSPAHVMCCRHTERPTTTIHHPRHPPTQRALPARPAPLLPGALPPAGRVVCGTHHLHPEVGQGLWVGEGGVPREQGGLRLAQHNLHPEVGQGRWGGEGLWGRLPVGEGGKHDGALCKLGRAL